MVPGVRDPRVKARRAGKSAYETGMEIVLTGIAVILPAVITIYILDAAMGILVSILDPIVRALVLVGIIPQIEQSGVVALLRTLGLYQNVSSFLSQLIAVVLLGGIIVGLGVVGRHRYGDRLIDYFDRVFMAIPGIGAVYKSFRRMSDVMLESEMENFRSVKLVEFPRDGTYVIGFETARPPTSIQEGAAVGDDMKTMFLPLAPNPVMGGFLTHIPEERIIDIDMTVEEGVRNIITSGIGTQETGEQLTEKELHEMGLTEEDFHRLGDQSGDESTEGAVDGDETAGDEAAGGDETASDGEPGGDGGASGGGGTADEDRP